MNQLDPEIVEALHAIEQANIPALNTLTAPQAREAFLSLRTDIEFPRALHQVSDIQIPSDQGTIPARVYRPTADDQAPALVWFHGGGWVLGNLDTADLPCRDLAHHSGCTVISVDYRLAPEAAFPAPFDDCLTATEWAFNNADTLNIDPSRIAVGGDSAGGNLAACVAIAARDHGYSIAYQLLIYPVIAAVFDTPSYKQNAEGYFLTTTMMQWFWDQYMPADTDRDDIRVAPINANLKGLPPAWVLTAGFDPLRDEGLNYAKVLTEAGIDVATLHVPDTIHGFFSMDITGGAKARETAGQVLAEAIAAA